MGARQALANFRQLLLQRGGNFARAWRCLLDTGGHGHLTLPELAQRCRALGFSENTRALWQALDEEGRGRITLTDIDASTTEVLLRFRAALLQRAELQEGSSLTEDAEQAPVVGTRRLRLGGEGTARAEAAATAMMRVLDYDGTQRVTRPEFCCILALLNLAPPGDIPRLFEMLCHATSASAASDRPAAVLQRGELRWLWLLGVPVRSIRQAKGGERIETKLGGGVADHLQESSGDAGMSSARLRRVWSNGPEVFKRLHDEAAVVQQRRDEVQRQLDDEAKAATEPSIASSGHVFDFLVKDAERRQAARQEAEAALEQHTPTSARREPDAEALARLAQPKADKAPEAVPCPESDCLKAINWSRVEELYKERAAWLQERERLKREQEEREIQEIAAAQVRVMGQARSQSRPLLARCRWRDLFERLQLFHTLPSAGTGSCDWQLLLQRATRAPALRLRIRRMVQVLQVQEDRRQVQEDRRPAFDELLGTMVPECWPLHQNLVSATDEPMQDRLMQVRTLEDPRTRSPLPNPMPTPHSPTPWAKHSPSPARSPAPKQNVGKIPADTPPRSITPPRPARSQASPAARSDLVGTRVREDRSCDALLSPELLASLSPCAKPLTAPRTATSGQPPPPAQGRSLHRLQPRGVRSGASCMVQAANMSPGGASASCGSVGLHATRRDRSAPR